jgi:hypothetical protein
MATFINVMMAVKSNCVDIPIYALVSVALRSAMYTIPERLPSSRTVSVA